jgi:hypothetical protein
VACVSPRPGACEAAGSWRGPRSSRQARRFAASGLSSTERRLARMAAVIAFRPETDRGQTILNQLEERYDIWPMQIVADGTRRYQLDGEGADVDGLDPMLTTIDPDWRAI